MRCPNCFVQNASEAERCKSCGESFLERQQAPPKNKDYMGDYFGFRAMVTPFWIELLYALGACVITIASLVAILFPEMFSNYGDNTNRTRFGGILVLIFGNLAWRLLCEAWILLFSVHSLLVSIDEKASRITDALANKEK